MELLDIQITCFQPFPHCVQQDVAIAKQLEALTVKTCGDVIVSHKEIWAGIIRKLMSRIDNPFDINKKSIPFSAREDLESLAWW